MADFQQKVFLGGTCGTSIWRKEVICRLSLKELPFFNPQKAEGEWREEDKEIEEQEKKASIAHNKTLPKVQCKVLCATILLRICLLQLCKALLFVIEDERSLYSLIEVAFLVSFFCPPLTLALLSVSIHKPSKICFRAVIPGSLLNASYLFSHTWTDLKGLKFGHRTQNILMLVLRL